VAGITDLGHYRASTMRTRRTGLVFFATAGSCLLATALASAEMPPDVSASASALELAPSPVPQPSAASQPDTIHAQVGTRVTFRLQNTQEKLRDHLDDASSEGEADVVLWGQVHPFLKWQAGFAGSYGDIEPRNRADVLDLVAKIEISDAFNLWVGRMPIPSDRASLSTVWALPTWTAPGVYSNYPLKNTSAISSIGPRYGSNGRGDGMTLWGQLYGGVIKYYAGVFDLEHPAASPLYSARISVNVLGAETGYRGSSGYYGNKNILAVGLSGQHQTEGSHSRDEPAPPINDFNELGGDLLIEMNGGGAGVVDVEGAFAKMWGNNELASYQAYALASYLVPIDVGIGRFQPLLRLQHAGSGNAYDATNFTGVDAQLGYIIDGYHARLLAIYQYAKLAGASENAILFGLQLLSHAR